MTINLLLEEGFDLEGNRERAVTKNYNLAKVWIKPNDTKEKLDQIKSGNTEKMSNNDRASYLLATHILRKTAANKRLKQETRDDATTLLKNAGIDLTSMRDEDRDIFRQASEHFNKEHEKINKGPEETPAEEPPEETKKAPSSVEEPSVTPDTTDIETPETKDSETLTTSEKELSPKETVDEIKKLGKETTDKMQKVIGRHQEEGKKERELKANKISKRFETKIKSYVEKANAGPRNARVALLLAKRDARVDLNSVNATSLKGALGRGIQGAKEGLERRSEAIKSAIGRTKEKLDKSENLKKVSDTYKKVKERVVQGTEKAVERVGEKISKSAEKGRVKTDQREQEGATTTTEKIKQGVKSAGEAVASKVGTVGSKIKDILNKRKEDNIKKNKTINVSDIIKHPTEKQAETPIEKPVNKPAQTKEAPQVVKQAETLSPEEEKKRNETIKKLAAQAANRKKGAVALSAARQPIKYVRGVRKIS
ncbi:MAG TPA: hypothetical protein VMZ91_10305 [Candidatus Paceibacterota bacterium]|nr:hypothetical protein [Candidatus Paceibacterota bacterium]